MSEPITPEWLHLQRRAFNLSCDDQLQLAKLIAANIGYEVVPSTDNYDEPTLADRVTNIEKLLTLTARAASSMLVGVDPSGRQGQWRDAIFEMLTVQDQQSGSDSK